MVQNGPTQFLFESGYHAWSWSWLNSGKNQSWSSKKKLLWKIYTKHIYSMKWCHGLATASPRHGNITHSLEVQAGHSTQDIVKLYLNRSFIPTSVSWSKARRKKDQQNFHDLFGWDAATNYPLHEYITERSLYIRLLSSLYLDFVLL